MATTALGSKPTVKIRNNRTHFRGEHFDVTICKMLQFCTCTLGYTSVCSNPKKKIYQPCTHTFWTPEIVFAQKYQQEIDASHFRKTQRGITITCIVIPFYETIPVPDLKWFMPNFMKGVQRYKKRFSNRSWNQLLSNFPKGIHHERNVFLRSFLKRFMSNFTKGIQTKKKLKSVNVKLYERSTALQKTFFCGS